MIPGESGPLAFPFISNADAQIEQDSLKNTQFKGLVYFRI